ncbi:MAG: DUF1615 domain-containing protein [Betaproteobacteria bacterium]|nr:DUF1615 domain-containing protein [Betaproteobacteria bacterium]
MLKLPNACPLLPAALIAVTLLAGCASSGSYESRPSPRLPPAPGAPSVTVVPTPVPAPPPAVVPGQTPPVAPSPAPSLRPPSGPSPLGAQARALVERLLPPRIPERNAWAADILGAFEALGLPASAENLCAVMAVIEQESSWQADPVVPGLPRIVWKELETRAARYGVPMLMVRAAMLKTSTGGRSYKARIDTLRTEKQLSALFEDMISELPLGRELFGDLNPVRTGGPMQVSIAFAGEHVRARPYPYGNGTELRREVFTRRGGVYFGTANLLDYPAEYSQPLYRFADFNAGRYSSRNAAFQDTVAQLARRRLTLDGDLLRYRDGAPAAEPSATQQALLLIAPRLGLSAAEVQRDLHLEKSDAFARTPLYRAVVTLAEQTLERPPPRELVPRIELKSPKIQRKLTTEWFARRVDMRLRNCLARDPVTPPGMTDARGAGR